MLKSVGIYCLLALTSAVGTAALMTQACGSPPDPDHPEPASPPGVQTPLGTADPGATSRDSASSEVGLEAFTPLLALPELASIRSKVDADEHVQAATELADRFADGRLPDFKNDPLQPRRFQYLLGLLNHAAEKYAVAAEAFQAAANPQWLLSDYASIEAARCWLKAGFPKRAIELLKEIDATGNPALSIELERYRGEAAEVLGDWETALDHFSAYLERAPSDGDWPDVSLRLGEALLERIRRSPAADDKAKWAERALPPVRRVLFTVRDDELAKRAHELEQRILGALTREARIKLTPVPIEQRAKELESLVDARRFSDAAIVAEELLDALGKKRRFDALGCEVQLLRNKALAGQKKWGKAVDAFGDVTRLCQDVDLRARALYLAGRYASYDKRYSTAVKLFAELERVAPEHRLADDARLLAAQSYDEMGAEARYTELLSSIVEDYPAGDMSLDGAFQLALRRIERADWSSAANILDRAVSSSKQSDIARGPEFAGRERYFRARSWAAMGELPKALDIYAELVSELPLSYYMLQAYSRLKSHDAERARQAVLDALVRSRQEPFAINAGEARERVAFKRALELLRQGEVPHAALELQQLGVGTDAVAVAPKLLWSAALLYERAGAPKQAFDLAKARLAEWVGRWPTGDWRRAWQLAYPRPYWDSVKRAASRYQVDPHLIYGVMREESQFDNRAASHADAYGLMQLILPTARHFGKKANLPHSKQALYRPGINITLGTMVLSNYREYFPTNPLLAIPGYNAGPGRPKRWLSEYQVPDFDVWVELIPFRETRRYTKRVLASRATYAFVYAEQAPGKALTEYEGPPPPSWAALELPLVLNRE